MESFMRPARAPRPHNRDGVWYLIRRVPKAFSAIDARGLVRISTGIAVAHDPRAKQAKVAVAQLNAGLETYWCHQRDGRDPDALSRFEAAVAHARSFGLTYKTNEELAEGPLSENLERINLIVERGSLENAEDVSAIMGGEPRPELRISDMLEEFEHISKASLATKSPNQLRKWRNPRKLAVSNLSDVVGDKEIGDITRSDTLKFRNHWLDKIVDEGIQITTANKNISYLGKMFREINRTHQMDLKPVFSELRIEGAKDRQRLAFPAEFVQSRLLSPGALDRLNEEARSLVYVIAELGLRLSEAVELDEKTILLEADIPHIKVSSLNRELKTEQSARDIPLVGNALAALQRHRNGFPRYRDKADSLSALVNNYLGTHKLLPSSEHSFYGLRHTFEDRLTAVEAPEKVIASLMGHKWIRPKYGAGPSLQQKQKWLKKISFKTPK
jgi:integrase